MNALIIAALFFFGLKLLKRIKEDSDKAKRERIKKQEAPAIDAYQRAEAARPKPSEMKVESFCLHCGAPVNPNKKQCEYCESFLPLMSAKIQRQNELDMDRAIKAMEYRHKERMKELEKKK